MKKKLIFAAAAIAMLASCSQNDLEAPVVGQAQQSDAIEFGTYLGKQATSRATIGTEDAMTTATMATSGFGVFAYYTGNDTYGSFRNTVYTAETAPTYTGPKTPNFMYNQKVYSTDAGTTWIYSPLKYWPNGNATADNAGATAEAEGKVSFFAYAPWVETIDGGSDIGIVNRIANDGTADPYVTYKRSNVDLLWGTLQSADNTVGGASQSGVTGDKDATANTYVKAILDGKTVAADLTKQELDGKVNFAFLHALAALDVKAQLWVDAIPTGANGSRESWTDASTDDSWRTIVTIKEVTITSDLDNDGTLDLEEVGVASEGSLNLATGVWTATENQLFSQNIKTINTGASEEKVFPKVELTQKMAEYKTGTNTTWVSDYTGASTKGYFAKSLTTHPGVTETAASVYADNEPMLMLIPTTAAPKVKVTVSYVVRTYDDKLATKYSEVPQTVSKTITFANKFDMSKKYTLLMRLGLTSVEFSASVADWTNGDEKAVDLPINVE